MKKKNINIDYSGQKNPDNLKIREILIQTISWQSWKAATMNNTNLQGFGNLEGL